MKLYAETQLIRIYWLADIEAGYGVWTGLPKPALTQQALDLASELLAKHGCRDWISNTEAALVSPPETQAIIVHWLRAMHACGQLERWADIPPESATARLVVKNLGTESVLHGIRFAQFDDLESAAQWLRLGRGAALPVARIAPPPALREPETRPHLHKAATAVDDPGKRSRIYR